MPPRKEIATKVGRKDVVLIQRNAQAIRESAYRMRATLEPGLDEEIVAPELVALVRDANDAVNTILASLAALMGKVDLFPVLENAD